VSRPAVGFPAEVGPNGVDVAWWQSGRPLAQLAGATNLLFVGRLEPRNGADLAIAAFVAMADAAPEARLVIAGDGPERHRLHAIVPPALVSRVLFLGPGARH